MTRHPARDGGPDLYYVFDADDGGGGGRGVSGVTGSDAVATDEMVAALHTMPDLAAAGMVRRVRLELTPRPYYVYGQVVARAWRDPVTGALVIVQGGA